ncbi:hypothetical protein [Pseudomonas palmensis]|uniref:hypothetical protein n=1 Tax=Pseudomonas palmensis TaxID=2815362 RepID=UPI001F1DAAC9|nr:hypothetical protein [Pseudomonas palmensis]
MPELFIALDAKIEWSQMTNPFGSGKAASQKVKPKPADVAEKLRQALTGMRAS